jgi:hypothetical protein
MTEPTKQPRPGVPVPPESLAHGWVNRVATSVYDDIADAAAWGADEQLRLCVEWLRRNGWPMAADELEPAMRSEPACLKRQALAALEFFEEPSRCTSLATARRLDSIRNALEALPDDK